MTSDHERLTVRFDPETKLYLDELKVALNTSYSLLIRSFIQDYLRIKESEFEQIIEKQKELDANN